MKLFRTKAEPDADGYYRTLPREILQESQISTVTINRQKIILTLYQGEVVAYDSRCPHAAADLSRGTLGGWKAICPDHSYCFDIRNGRLTWPEDEPYRLKIYPTRLEAGHIYIKL